MKLLLILLIISAAAVDFPLAQIPPLGPFPDAPNGAPPGVPTGALPVPPKEGQTQCLILTPCGGYVVEETPANMTSEQCSSLEEDKKCHVQTLFACTQQEYTGKDEDIQKRAEKQKQLEDDYTNKCTNGSTEEQDEGSIGCGQIYLCGSDDQALPENMTEVECRQFDMSRSCHRSSLADCRTKEYINKKEDIARRERNIKKLEDTYRAKCAAYSSSVIQDECFTSELKPCEGYAEEETPQTMTSEQCSRLKEDKNCQYQLMLACRGQEYTGKDEDMAKRDQKHQQLEKDYTNKCTSGASAATLSALCLVLCGFFSLLF